MLTERISCWGTAVFRDPASPGTILEAEAQLGAPMPDELRDLLRETDGLEGEYGLDLVWTAERVGTDNARFRSDPDFAELYMTFEGLLFFADAGNGDQFAISLRGPQDIFVWNHEDDSRTWVASTVMNFLRAWMTGELSV